MTWSNCQTAGQVVDMLDAAGQIEITHADGLWTFTIAGITARATSQRKALMRWAEAAAITRAKP